MSYFTQDEISETWDRVKSGDDLDGSRIVTDNELEQSLTIPTVANFTSIKDDFAGFFCTRKRESKEERWGSWVATD